MRYTVFIIGFVFLLAACNIRKAIKPTVRERYERSFKGPDSLLKKWQLAYHQALQQPVTVALPLVITVRVPDSVPAALSFRFAVNQGQVLIAELDKQDDSAILLTELFHHHKNEATAMNMLQEMDPAGTVMKFPVTTNDTVIIVLQPGITTRSSFRFRIYPQPGYVFPVAGKGNAAITSFWEQTGMQAPANTKALT